MPEIEAYLRDCAFNRGPGGAAKILQMALGVTVDGGVGPETLGTLRQAEKGLAKLLAALRVPREKYELRVAGGGKNSGKASSIVGRTRLPSRRVKPEH